MDATPVPPIIMDRPCIPRLRGKENLHEWTNIVTQWFRFYNCADYLVKDETQMAKTPRNQAWTIIKLVESLDRIVMDSLVFVGWQPGDIDQDPKELYDLIQQVAPHVTDNIEELHARLRNLDPDHYASLEDYQTAVEFTRFLIGRGCELDDAYGVRSVMNAVRESRPTWHRSLRRAWRAGRLTWPRLMVWMRSRVELERPAGEEVVEEEQGGVGSGEVDVRMEVKKEDEDEPEVIKILDDY